jgi:peroxiredoxin
VIGVPGAFTPVCSEEHVPGLVANADKLRKWGFRQIVCIVASDPFATDAWAKLMDPQGKVRFVSDGNLDFAREFGLIVHEHKLVLGDRSERYLFAVRDGVIEVFRLEQRITDYSCTASDDFVLQDT